MLLFDVLTLLRKEHATRYVNQLLESLLTLHGPAKPKADVTLSMADQTFQDLADGKLNGQKAFMGGKACRDAGD